MTPLRVFPIRLPPLSGEALDSWLEAQAHRMYTCLGDLLAGAGLADREHTGGARDWTIVLGPDEAAGIATATCVPRPEVEAMTLACYDGIALRIDRPTRRVSRNQLWGRGSGSRYCPDCLASSGGRWLLAWRLGWCFACPAHRRLLADICPACRRAQRQRPHPGHVIPQPGRCARAARSGLAAQRCSADLAHADTVSFPAGHPVLAAQQFLLDVIGSGIAAFGVYADDPQPARAALADVRALANRILTYATSDDLAAIMPADVLLACGDAHSLSITAAEPPQGQCRPGFMAPRQATTAAVGVTAAIAVLGAPDIETAGAALRWLVERSRRRGLAVSPTTIRSWGRGTSPTLTAVQLSALDPLLNPSDRLRYRTGTGNPRRPPPGTAVADRRARHIPTLLWSGWSLRFALPHRYQQHLRPALSCALLTIGTRLRLSTVAGQLGAATDGRRVSRILQLLEADPCWPHIVTGLTRAADYLDAHDPPIDYQRRRGLSYDNLLPNDAWSCLCLHTGTPAGTRKAAVARSVLFERISGLPASRAPFAIDDADFRARVASFRPTSPLRLRLASTRRPATSCRITTSMANP